MNILIGTQAGANRTRCSEQIELGVGGFAMTFIRPWHFHRNSSLAMEWNGANLRAASFLLDSLAAGTDKQTLNFENYSLVAFFSRLSR